MTQCIEKLPHRTDKCNSGDGVQVFMDTAGKYSAYCFACSTYIPDPYQDKPKDYKPAVAFRSPKQIEEEIEQISKYKVVDLPERKLKKASLDYFGVKIGLSEQDGTTPHSHYYPYYKEDKLIAYKVRLIENKKFWAVGSTKDVDLFGWRQAIATGAKKLFICEGEIDAISLYQISKDQNKGTQYAELNPAVVSLVNGAGSAPRDILKYLPEIRKHFKEIILVFDEDVAGKGAANEVAKLVPEVLIASLPEKDVNECLKQGKNKAVYNAVQFNAVRAKNTRLVSGDSLHESAKKPPEFGYSWPWEHITKATRGIRMGETIYIGAGQKQGKSEVVNTLAAHFIREHKLKVFLVKPEESNNKTYKLVAGKLAGKIFHDPNRPFDEDAYNKAGEELQGNLFMLNIYQHVGWETLKADIRLAASEGCKAIIIDPITNLTNGIAASDANTKLQEIAQELSAMALDLNVVIFIFCHLRNPDSGVPHERGGEVLSSQFAGSRAMARSCNLMLGLEGNRDPSLPIEQKNLRTLVLLEDREFGETGRFKLYWDQATGLFNEL
jgi:twinkle protein